jgi:hypothetical protein
MSNRRPALLSLAFVVIAVLSAAAQPAWAQNTSRAKELFQEGTTFFDLGQFEKAIESWQQGYKEKPDPGFLYNIAQAYRLAGDPQKAIFFYRGYLRNSPPHVHNRAEVEQKIAALQKLISDSDKTKQIPPPGVLKPDSATAGTTQNGTAAAGTGGTVATNPPPGTGGTPPPTTLGAGATEPPPVSSSPGTAPSTEPAGVVSETPPTVPPPPRERRADVGAGLGTAFWTSGVQGSTQPSFALEIAGGYSFGSTARPVQFHFGGALGYTFLTEPSSKETFVSLLLVPGLRFRLIPQRLVLAADLGVGAMLISGIKSTSALLVHQNNLIVNGTQGLLELRPALALEYAFTRTVAAFVSPALAIGAKKEHFYGSIGRLELLAGVTFRL